MPAMIVASFTVPIGLLYVILSYLARAALEYGRVQLVRMVRASKTTLDNAHHWFWHIRFW